MKKFNETTIHPVSFSEDVKNSYSDILTNEAMDFLVQLHEKFNSERLELLERRVAQQNYFDKIVKSRESSTWDENHIVLATNLAVNYSQLDEANCEIETKGLMVLSEKGWPVTNPAITAKQSLMSTVLQINKALGLSASQKGVSGKDQESRNKADRETRNILDKVASDDLI